MPPPCVRLAMLVCEGRRTPWSCTLKLTRPAMLAYALRRISEPLHYERAAHSFPTWMRPHGRHAVRRIERATRSPDVAEPAEIRF